MLGGVEMAMGELARLKGEANAQFKARERGRERKKESGRASDRV